MSPVAHSADDPPFDDLIPRRIRQLRVRLNLTAQALDRQAGLGPGTIGRLERGEQRIYANHLFRIASATGIDIAWLYGNAANQDEGRRLIETYMRIADPVLKRDVFELIESLAQDGQGAKPPSR